MIKAEDLEHSESWNSYKEMWKEKLPETQIYITELCNLENNITKKEKLEKILELLNSCLYYELSLAVEEYLKFDTQAECLQKMMFFDVILGPIYKYINPLQFVNLLSLVILSADADVALGFLEKFENQVEKLDSSDASIIFTSSQAFHYARLSEIKTCEDLLDKIEDILKFDMNLELCVYTAYHKAHMKLNLVAERYAEFCKHTILFFSYTPLDLISNEEKLDVALELTKSALIAENMYDFGDILQLSPINENLKNSEHGWTVELLTIFDEGDMKRYFPLIETKKQDLDNLNMTSHLTNMHQKITILALMDYAFQQPKNERVIEFSKIADHCKVELDQVEILLMKAMTYNLIKGKIDEVNKVVNVEWVKPRILDASRMDLMKQRLENWATVAEQLQKHIEGLTEELLA